LHDKFVGTNIILAKVAPADGAAQPPPDQGFKSIEESSWARTSSTD